MPKSLSRVLVVFEILFNIYLVLVLAEGAQSSSCEQQSEAAPFKPEGTVPSRLALGGRGAYSTRCWGSPVRQKKKHTGEKHRALHFYVTLNSYTKFCLHT